MWLLCVIAFSYFHIFLYELAIEPLLIFSIEYILCLPKEHIDISNVIQVIFIRPSVSYLNFNLSFYFQIQFFLHALEKPECLFP